MASPNEALVSGFVISLASGLLVYWVSRVLILLRGSEEELQERLDADLEMGRQLWWQLRHLFAPPQSFLLP